MMKNFTKLFAFFALCLFARDAMAQATYHVNVAQTTSGDGLTWGTAFKDLQEALTVVTSGDEIWVAKGTYYPITKLDPAGTDRDKTFILKEGVKVYGGFTGAGTETSVNDRVNISTTNETVLSGDFNGDDVVTLDVNGTIESITGNTENAHHVVVSYNNTAATVLDGFTIKGGNADEIGTIIVDTDYSFNKQYGAGIFVNESSPTLNNLTVSYNHALLRGAGIYVSGGKRNESPTSADDITISNSLVAYNWGSDVGTSFSGSAGGGLGITGTTGYLYKGNLNNLNFLGNWAGGLAGGLRVFANVDVEVTNSTFSKNRSRHGGAVYVQSNPLTPLKIISSTFSNNIGANGGAIEGNNGTNLIIENTNFSENTGTNGGGIYILGSAGASRSVLNITGGKFNENTATTGGAIRVSQSVELNIDGTDFIKNAGGAINFLGAADLPSNAIINNANFIENSFTEGGAIRASTNSTLNLTNSNFKKNTSTIHGGAIYMTGLAANMSIINISGGVLEENYTDGMGGALYRLTNSKLSIDNVQFISNAPKGSGAAMYVSGDNGTEDSYNNVLFYRNTSTTTSGGGITIAGSAKVKLVGATFYENESTAGGAIRLTSINGSLKLYNSIVYNNIARTDNTHDISDAGAAVEIKNTLTQVYGTDGVDGVKVSAVPLFLSTIDGNADFLKLAPITGNPAIDAGDNLLIPSGITTDLAGQARIHNGTVDLGAYENLSTLPIKLLDFSAKAKNNAVQVNWLTETETNNDYFLLERSADGVSYSLLTKTPSKGNTGATYNYTDYSPVAGTSYYRLTQVDKDGTKVTFDPKAVNFSLQNQLSVSVYPNPAVGGKITINLAGNKFTTLQVVSLQGQRLQSLNIAANETEKTLDISAYPSGTYFIVLSNGTEKTVKKILKP